MRWVSQWKRAIAGTREGTQSETHGTIWTAPATCTQEYTKPLLEVSSNYEGILPSFILAFQDVLVSCCGKPRYSDGRMYNQPRVLKNVCTLLFVLFSVLWCIHYT